MPTRVLLDETVGTLAGAEALDDAFGPSLPVHVIRVRDGAAERRTQRVATEVPFTIMANDAELATMLCTPGDLVELTCGFLFASGFIRAADELLGCVIDTTRWVVHATLARSPDPEQIRKRLYTSGCGKGVMYGSLVELSSRRPRPSDLCLTVSQVSACAAWLQDASELYRSTGGVHTAALCEPGADPRVTMDDIGRHNAVDKVIGWGLRHACDFARQILITSGRVSSEILHKAARAGIPVIVARGAPTHQSVFRAAEAGITIIGFARGQNFTVYSGAERLTDCPTEAAL